MSRRFVAIKIAVWLDDEASSNLLLLTFLVLLGQQDGLDVR